METKGHKEIQFKSLNGYKKLKNLTMYEAIIIENMKLANK